MSVPCRRHHPQGVDFSSATMQLAEQCWRELRNELLSSVDDPRQLWAYRRFELGEQLPK
jgi:hypothetical protein